MAIKPAVLLTVALMAGAGCSQPSDDEIRLADCLGVRPSQVHLVFSDDGEFDSVEINGIPLDGVKQRLDPCIEAVGLS